MITLRRDNVVKQTESEVVALALESQGFVREGAAKKAAPENEASAAEKELKERYAAIGEMHASYNVENDLWQMELHYKKEVDLREEIFYYMAEHRLPIYEMKMTSKSLEDVFLELTKEQEKSAAAEEMTGRTAKERAAEENSQTAETTQKEETDNAGNMEKGI